MHKLQLCLVFCLFAISMAYGQSEGWLPITDADLQFKEVPGDPGASAVQLYYADYIDDNLHSEFLYRRIKVLSEKGNKYADVEIPVFIPGSSISELKARTIHPDGKIIDFSGKPFEKTIAKGQGIKYLAKAFTLPEVTVGSIIEYKYLVMMPEDTIYDNSWTIQHDLYAVKQSFVMKAYKGALETKHGGQAGLSMVYNNMPADLKPQQKSANTWEMQASNIPAFQAEDYMPPEENYEPQVRFFYGGSEITSVDRFWQQVDRDWNSAAEHFIGNHDEIRKVAADVIGQETDPEQQLRKLYDRAQQIRNLSYERDRTQQELKQESLKSNGNAVDVLSHGYGTRRDVVYFFVALARAAKFPASVLLASSRKEHFFDKSFMSERQLDTVIAVVKVKGEDVYLDPGTKFCPYGFVRWMSTSATALKLDKDGGTFIVVPPVRYDKAVAHRDAVLTLGEDGSLSGDLTVQFLGGEALEHRLDALETDEAGRKRSLEDEVKGWVTSGAIVELTKATGWDGEDIPLLCLFHIQIPGYASVAGKRLLLPPYLFLTKEMDAFKYPNRKYPVYFPYSYTEMDSITIKVPPGYAIEGGPKSQDAKLSYAAYRIVGEADSGQLVTRRQLLFNAIFIDPTRYAEVKDFFSKVAAGDEQQAVLHVAEGSKQASTN